ncbi:hypothetical protein Btru_070165 [Bulinus truncatus]|nr:hypothetical protein Btru_070165 [Bulinus truncatus]
MVDSDTFTVVKSRKSKKSFKHPELFEIKDSIEDRSDFDLKNFLKRLNACIVEVEVSDFFNFSFDIINRAISDLKEQKTINSISFCQKETAFNGKSAQLDIVNTSSQQTEKNCLSDLNGRLEAVHVAGDRDAQKIQLLSYGIGNFTSSLIARYQLAFLISLQNKFDKQCTACSVYDPVFLDEEKLVLQKYGCEIIHQNEEGCRECTDLTVAFLPHCGRPLYNNLLWRNLNTPAGLGLNNLVLIGNSLSQIIERTPKSILKDTGSYIIKVQPFAKEKDLPDNFVLKDVFNDLAVHTFPVQAIKAIFADGEPCLEKPQYDLNDEEFIRK